MKRALLAVVAALGLSACGYRFAARGEGLPTDGKRVFAPTFSNDTSEAGVEVEFTNAFRAELANAHLDGPADAPVQARGSIGQMVGGPGQTYFGANGQPSTPSGALNAAASYYVFVNACVRLVEGEKVLGSSCVSGSEDYAPGLDALQIEAARRIALRRLAGRLMRQAFEQLSTRF